jgi:1-deoxy-D-xylulose-5-phosphate synthase
VPSSLFEKFNVRYIGPIDGHDQAQVERYLEFAKQAEQPVLLHILTNKGKGYDVALKNPERFHGASPFDITTGKSAPATGNPGPKYQDVMGNTLVKLAKDDQNIVGITAAMPSGTGLNILEQALPEQFIDVGIAEEHAVLAAAGMATSGFHPVCAIYSTFLQRAYDQLIHDVALQNLPVMFCMDRAGLSPNDGATHHGLFDLSYLRNIPGAVVMAPSNEDELADMMATGIAYQGPSFVRYPRGEGPGTPIKESPQALELGIAQRLHPEGEIEIWAIGSMVADAELLARQLNDQGIQAGVINARFVKPLDTKRLLESAHCSSLIVTMEDNIISGGFGTAVMEALQANNCLHAVERIGWPDQFIEHGSSVAALRDTVGLNPQSILDRVLERYRALETTKYNEVQP